MLKYILGCAGSGKTEYVFNSIKQKVSDGEENIILITPEQYSFSAERRLLNDLGERNINKVKNISFSHFANIISKKYGPPPRPVLSKGAKAVMMKKAIESVQDGLVLFHNKVGDNSFISSFISIYDEMKSCRVSADDIIDASSTCDKELLSAKLTDIAAITLAYESLIQDQYIDPANELTVVYEKLLTTDFFENSVVYIDGFFGFVAQEYKIIEAILNQAKEVYVTFCSDTYSAGDKYDLFSYVNSNIAILTSVAKKCKTAVLAPIILGDNLRAGNDELRVIESSFYSNVKKQLPQECKHVAVYRARNICDECDKVSANIASLLRSGYNASDIAVVCRDLDKYENEIKFSFNKYDIPYFNDERQNINNESLVMFISFLMRTIIYSYRSEDIFSLLKTGLTSLSADKISHLENYVYMWKISGTAWKRDFVESTKGFVDKISEDDRRAIDEINASRSFIISAVTKFASRARNKTPREISRAIYYALLDLGVDEGVKRLAMSLDRQGKSSLAKEQGRIWDLMMQILDKLALVGGDTPVSMKEYYKIFNLMISYEDLGVLPSGLDNVQIGCADRIRYDHPKAVFVVGANEGEFPKSVVSSGLLSEPDRLTLIHNDFKLYSYGETLNAQEKFFAYMAVSAPSDKLFVSYIANGEHSESNIVREIKAILPGLTEQHYRDCVTVEDIFSKDNAFDLLTSHYSSNTEIINSLKAYFLSNQDYAARMGAIERIVSNHDIYLEDKAVAERLFKKNMYLSASRIEEYYNCAFRYFCKFGLGARPRIKAEMDPMQTGTVIHYVLEHIVKENRADGLANLTDMKIKSEVNRLLNYYMTNMLGDLSQFNTRFKYQFLRLSKMLVEVVIRLREEFENSDYRPDAFELKIGDGTGKEPVKSAVIPLDNGGTITIKGSIDRVDTYEENGIKYVRVVDYKSGTKKYQLSDVLYGLNLQMLIYLFSLCKSDSDYSGIASGVLYMHSARSVFNMQRNVGSDELSKKENAEFRMQGLVLNDSDHELAKHMEHDLEGKYIPVKYSKRDGITGNIVSLSEIGILSKKIDFLVAAMGNKLLDGRISQNPVDGLYHDKTCEYCDYRDVCKNRIEIQTRPVESVANDEVMRMLKEEFVDE